MYSREEMQPRRLGSAGIEAGPQRDEMAALPYVCSPSEAVGHDAEDALSLEKL